MDKEKGDRIVWGRIGLNEGREINYEDINKIP